MSTLRTPVGPQPPSVYWRRRLLVLLGLVAVITIIVLIVWNGGRSTEEARETPKPNGSPSASAESEEPLASGECNPAVIQLEAITDTDSYASGQNVQISMRVTNTGSSACTFVVAADQLVYSIVSGADPIWTSAHCLSTPAFEVELMPNSPLGNDPITWDRTRSDTTTCDTARDQVTAGGATYRLSVAIGEITSPEGGTPFLLN